MNSSSAPSVYPGNFILPRDGKRSRHDGLAALRATALRPALIRNAASLLVAVGGSPACRVALPGRVILACLDYQSIWRGLTAPHHANGSAPRPPLVVGRQSEDHSPVAPPELLRPAAPIASASLPDNQFGRHDMPDREDVLRHPPRSRTPPTALPARSAPRRHRSRTRPPVRTPRVQQSQRRRPATRRSCTPRPEGTRSARGFSQ